MIHAIPASLSTATLAQASDYVIGVLVVVSVLLLAAYLWTRLRVRAGELRASEEQWRLVFEHAAVAMVQEDLTMLAARLETLRSEGVGDRGARLSAEPALLAELYGLVRFTAANRRARELLGAASTEEFHARAQRLGAGRVPPTFPRVVEALWNGRSTMTTETTVAIPGLPTRVGLFHWTVPTHGGRPDLSRVLLMFTDLTELRTTEERYRLLFEGAAEGVFETLAEGGFQRANPAMARMLGYGSPAELLAMPPETFQGIYVQPGRRAEFLARLGGGDAVTDFESEVRRRDGSTIWISENVHVVRDPQGRPHYLQGFVTDITARKRAELALRESEQRFRLLFEQAPVAIVEFDHTGLLEWFERKRAEGVTDLEAHFAAHPEERAEALARAPLSAMNETTLRIFGAASKEELIRRLPEVLTPEAVALRVNNIVVRWRGGHQTEGEMPLRVLGGGVRHFFYRWWMPPVDGRPGLIRSQTVLVDITAVREAERALRESEQRYRILFEHSPVAILEFDYRAARAWLDGLRAAGVTDLAAHFTRVPGELDTAIRLVPPVGANDAALRLFGAASRKDLVDGLERVFTPDALEVSRRIHLAMWEGATYAEGDLALQTFDGTVRQVHLHWWVPTVEGRPHYARAQLAVLDLTEVKAAERALAAERERLRVTLAAMSEGVITVDPAGTIRFINDAACELTGWNAADATGRLIDEVCALRHARTGAPVHAPVASVLVSDRVLDLPPQTVVQQRGRRELLVEGRCAPMHDTAGRGVGAVLVIRDVTERSRLEVDLMRASKLESVGILAGGIAHDFNNILAVVVGNLTLAQMDQQLAPETQRWLREAEKGAQRARDLTQQLLTFAKGGEPVRSAVRLGEVVREAAEFALHGSTARCEFRVEEPLWPADADKGQIGQVVQNLIINAAQAMPEGGVIRVGLRNEEVARGAMAAVPAGRYLALEVADTGTGIAPEHLARIFEPYFTTKQSGTGLGLATVYSIVKKHRGHVAVESEPGRGTTFRLLLPAAQADPGAVAASQSPFDGIRGRILFMDDEEPIRQMADSLLSRLGMEPCVVADGAAAVRAYAEARDAGRPFDVVMMDLTVPGGMGGLQALRELLRIDPQVRAIVSSGYSSDPVMANHRAHGFSGMVPKPFRVSELAAVLRDVLGRK